MGTLITDDCLSPTHNKANDFEITWDHPVQCIAYLWDGAADESNGHLDKSMVPSVIAFDKATMPVIDIHPGTAQDGKDTVFLSGTIGARMRYTTDGTTPTPSSTLYGNEGEPDEAGATGYFFIRHGNAADSTMVIRAISEMRGCFNSSVATLTLEPPTVTINGTQVTITGPVGSTLTYTINDGAPVTNMAGATRVGTYVNSNTISFSVPDASADCTIKAVAQKPGYAPSYMGAAVYRASTSNP